MPLYDPTEQVGTASIAPPRPPGAPPPNVIYRTGGIPDYKTLLESDPGYLAAKGTANEAAATAAAQRRATLRSALIRYGGIPSGFEDKYSDIDQATRDAASGNEFSTLGNLARGYAESTDKLKRSLGARGMLQSGDLSYGTDQLERAYGQQRYDVGNQLTDQANQIYSGYSGVLGGNAQALSQAIAQAEGNVYSNPANRPTETTANYDASLSAQHGQAIYSDAQGNLYDVYGNPFSPSGPTPVTAQGPMTYAQAGYTQGPNGTVIDPSGNVISTIAPPPPDTEIHGTPLPSFDPSSPYYTGPQPNPLYGTAPAGTDAYLRRVFREASYGA